ncbi:acetyltransferase [Stenotrophomonas sp. C3(2023)]|uniref:acetyltransferase n=1 Tax=Stenotrophomonas sp. C3(2023) TaxID=3080277 RepID=UPI00293C4933|nr:acetyltransferase [Stenotrophomonas sp. C3(2023)]MDV3467588.1 acetyltransferase [Stenotrophomonas sp. C3(2023)]
MWWNDVAALETWLADTIAAIDPTADVARDAVIEGAVRIGARSRVCPGARIEGPVVIGDDCLIGNNALIRPCTLIGPGCRIGFAVEMKHAWLEERVSVGPQCYVADSVLEPDVYLGAQVRTSNHRLDRQTIKVRQGDAWLDTGMEKLGCLIGAGSSLGIQCIVLPGRCVAPRTTLGPRITVVRNLPAGRYQLRQDLDTY